MNKAGDADWDELTKHGKKYPSVCLDEDHPYYVLIWSTIDATAVSDASASVELYVLEGGCIAFPPVFGTARISRTKENAAKKVLEETLRFVAEKGKQPAPTPSDLGCYPPEWIGPTKYKLTRGTRTASAEATQPRAIQPTQDQGTTVVGSGFFVSEYGHVLTNAHVVSSCKQIQTRDRRRLSLVDKDEQADLALLHLPGEVRAVATFRVRPLPRAGDAAIAFGFPLQGLLSSEGNLSTGTVAATSGLADDPRFIQMSAPVQPGNSGSPLLDSSGDVIGIVESKLDAVQAFRTIGDVPENVNFAVRASEAIAFLERNHVTYRSEATDSILNLRVPDIAARAKEFSLPIECIQ